MKILRGAFLVLVLAFLAACGGGGGESTSLPSFTANTATVSFSLLSTAKLPFRMTGFELTAALPTGVTVAKNGAAILPTVLVAGSALSGAASQVPLAGSYVAPNVTISYVGNQQTGFGPGEMARLTCSLGTGMTFSESNRLALENEINSNFLASGWDPTAGTNPSSLKSFLKAKVSVVNSN